MRPRWTVALLALIGLAPLVTARAVGQSPARPPAADRQWAGWVEPDFPYFSSVLDARAAGAGLPSLNLSPRAIVLNLGRDRWAAFDVDLLRVAAIWTGRGVTPLALAPGSYNKPDKKSPGGQFPAPAPDGHVWLANGVYPGWQEGEQVAFVDPREPAPSPEEVGRGPLSERQGRFTAIGLEPDGVVLEYSAGGADVAERVRVSTEGPASITRRFQVGPSSQPLVLVLGSTAAGTLVELAPPQGRASGLALVKEAWTEAADGVWVVRIGPRPRAVDFAVRFVEPSTSSECRDSGHGSRGSDGCVASTSATPRSASRRWPQEVVTGITRSTSTDPFVVDDVALPLDNPWRRNVRISDIQFLPDGTAFGVTLDGDVWAIRGLASRDGRVHWRRFASGLHEPLTLAVRDGEIYVFDRNGIWRLRDTDGDGEADRHELFSNAFAQTADMREFPSTIRTAPRGEFVIAKGGQEATTIGKHNGSVLRISADGRTATVLGYGFRQPNISVDPASGLVLASDQQGHYIPSTPLHVVRDRQFYGFLSDKLPREVYPAPIAEPLTWIPHTANASAMSQVWLRGARMGPLTDGLVHIGFNSPELFRVMLNEREPRLQAAVVSITRAFDFPPLHGSVNPADGQLYLAGFQIFGWGTTATRLAGLGRVRYTGAPSTLPRDVVPMDAGVLVRFDSPVARAAAENADNFTLATWHYKRTYQYGSPQLKADGTPGIDTLVPSRSYLSRDGRSVFIAVPGMKRVEQMRIAWTLATPDGTPSQNVVYFTPYELTRFDPAREGFGDITVDLTPRTAPAVGAASSATAAEGQRLARLYGCTACHATDAASGDRLGPPWRGLYGNVRPIAGGTLRVVADDAYLRESMLNPAAKVVAGYERGEAGMPSYAGVLGDADIESLVLFIKSLK